MKTKSKSKKNHHELSSTALVAESGALLCKYLTCIEDDLESGANPDALATALQSATANVLLRFRNKLDAAKIIHGSAIEVLRLDEPLSSHAKH